jgi:hypothetical protein
MVVYEGPSLINGEPVVVIATGLDKPSTNRKTGPMVQTYILLADERPRDAIQSGKDEAICGSCPARGGWCYAIQGRAGLGMQGIYTRWRSGSYPKYRKKAFAGKAVRLGAYGDPAAVPTRVWSDLLSVARTHTGYTHQWRTCDQELRKYCMASVDNLEEFEEAAAAGWRCYRVTESLSTKQQGEVACPFYTIGLQCDACGYCRGGIARPRGHVVVEVHGARSKLFSEQQPTPKAA